MAVKIGPKEWLSWGAKMRCSAELEIEAGGTSQCMTSQVEHLIWLIKPWTMQKCKKGNQQEMAFFETGEKVYWLVLG